MFVKRQKTPKYQEGLKTNSPKTHVQGFFVVPLVSSWSPIVFVYLVHCKSVTHLVIFYFWCFVFLLLGGCVSFFVSIFVFIVLFVLDSVVSLSCIFSLCDQKLRSNHKIFKTLISMFCFGACILALSLGPAKNPCSAQRNTPQNGICFMDFGPEQCAEIPIFTVFLEHQPKFPRSRWALKKTITFHHVQNQNWCFRNGLLGKIEKH